MHIWGPFSEWKWQGRLGFHCELFTIHIFPRNNKSNWWYKNDEGWQSLDLGPLVTLCWFKEQPARKPLELS